MIKKARFICCVLIALGIMLTFSSCWTLREKIYYNDKENFVTVSGVVTFINLTDDGLLYLGIDLEENHGFSDSSFKLNEANTDIVVKNGLLDSLTIGKRCTIISAPKYFGDGYVYPIVEIQIDDCVYLEFDQGYKNFMKKYDKGLL